ncbi:RteC domain-containing protein [Parabacteroides sp.]
MEKYFNMLLQEIERRMSATAADMDGDKAIATSRDMVSYLKGKARELKAFALAHPFSDEAEEIRFFKYYKPALTGRLLYYYRVYQIESGCPACREVAAAHYRKAMERAGQMMERHLPFYQYYRSGATYRDSYYFTCRWHEPNPESGSFVLDEEAEFSTGYDMLAARLISVEMLLDYLNRKIHLPTREADTATGKAHHWTGTKISAIQIIYGIHAAGSVDNGNAEIGELVLLLTALLLRC